MKFRSDENLAMYKEIASQLTSLQAKLDELSWKVAKLEGMVQATASMIRASDSNRIKAIPADDQMVNTVPAENAQ
jgi:outer membrane murein-binding lipoprotein Lpp